MITRNSFNPAGNIIEIQVDTSCEMAAVSLNGKCVMEGNFWDFHPGCNGPIIDDPEFQNWKGYSSLAISIIGYANKYGFDIQTKKTNYEYIK